MMRINAFKAAKQFISRFHPKCDAAILAGSVVRGEETSKSDLDIIVFDSKVKASYRESLYAFGWPIEVFVHNMTSYKDFFESDCERGRPSLPRMVSEGITIAGEEIVQSIKREASSLLDKGPQAWSEQTIKVKRYFITDVLDDFIGASQRAELLFIANTLADLLHEFVLRTKGMWTGSSKWIYKALKNYDLTFADHFTEAFDRFYKDGDKELIIKLVDEVLEPYGGRLFEGFSIGKC